MVLRFVQISSEERAHSAGAVDLVMDARTGTGHPVSVAEVACTVESGLDRPLSEFAPASQSAGPTGLEPGGVSFPVPRTALLVFAATLIAGCAIGQTARHGRGNHHCSHHRAGHVRLGEHERPRGPSRASDAERPSDTSH